MRETTALYKQLRTMPGSYYEVRITRGTTTYGPNRLKSLTISPALFAESGPGIGSAPSAKCTVTLIEKTDNWPRMAQFTVSLRLHSEDNSLTSEWLDMGTFYTDEREENPYGDLSVTAYDGMLLLEQTWVDKLTSSQLPANWPITALQAASLIATATGVVIDSRTVLDNTVAFVGLNSERTARDTLKDIAAAHGGNFVITADNRLRLVPLANIIDGSAAIAGIAIAGVSVVGDSELNAVGSTAQTAYLGMNVMSMTEGEPLDAVSGVILETESGERSTAGTDSGYVLNGMCEFSVNNTANLALARTNGFVYRPFEATGALLDPAAEVGDVVIIAGKNYQMCHIGWTLGAWITADIGAEYEEEVDHEYKRVPEGTKVLRKALEADDRLNAELRSYIQQTAGEIEIGVVQKQLGDANLIAMCETSPGYITSRGTVTDHHFFSTSALIPAVGSEIFAFQVWDGNLSTAFRICAFYDENAAIIDESYQQMIGAGADPFQVFLTAPAHAAYVRASWNVAAEKVQLTRGESFPSYREAAADISHNLGTNYSTTTEMNAAINLKAGEITQSVSATYATKSASITSETIHYLATSASTGVTTETSGWTTAPQSVTAVNKYLWTYSTYTYGDSHTADTTPVITGVYGDKGDTGDTGATGQTGPTGTGITSVESLYYGSASATPPAAPSAQVTTVSAVYNQWTKTCPEVTQTYPYVHTCDQVLYTDNTYKWTTPVADGAVTGLYTLINQTAGDLNVEIGKKVGNSEVRSKFAADPTGITVSSGKVKFEANTFELASDKLTVAADGNMTLVGPGYAGYMESGAYVGKVKTNIGRFHVYDGTGAIFGENLSSGSVITEGDVSGFRIFGDGNTDNNRSYDQSLFLIPGARPNGWTSAKSIIAASGILNIISGTRGAAANGYMDLALNDFSLGINDSACPMYIRGDAGVGDLSLALYPAGLAQNYKHLTLDETDLYTNTRFQCASLYSSGTKSRLVKTENYDDRLHYCYEMPSPLFGDIGEGRTDDDGLCCISIDDIFSETVRTDMQYQVFLQKEGQGDLWVEEKTPTYFVVRGTPELSFAWEIKCHQRGYETERLDNPEQTREGDNVNSQLYFAVTQYADDPYELIEEQEAIYAEDLQIYINEQEELLDETA